MLGVGGQTPSCELVELHRSISLFLSHWPTSDSSPSQDSIDLVALRQCQDLLEVAFSQLASRFALSDEYDRQGSLSPGEWIRINCRMQGRAADDRIAVGVELERLPASLEALRAGEIGFPHLALMGRTAAALGDFDENLLLARAKEVSAGKFWHLCMHARHVHDREAVVREQAAGVEARSLSLSTAEDGSLLLSGVLDAGGGAVLRNLLEPLARRSGRDDRRRRPQRLGDALVEAAMQLLDGGGRVAGGGRRTQLQVTASLETLLGLAGAPGGEMEFSTPVSYRTVARIACDCNVVRVLMDPLGRPVDVGRARRIVAGATRLALNARDRGCQWPGGCDRPASWSEGHHLRHWVHGGRSDLENLVLLCRRHHWKVHEGGWQLIRDADGRLHAVAPVSGYEHFFAA